MSSDCGTVDKGVRYQAKGNLQVWFNPHDGQIFNNNNNSTKSTFIREDNSNITPQGGTETDGKFGARIRKISQPLIAKKKSIANENQLDPYLLPSNQHLLHTLSQKTPLLERQQDKGPTPKRKITKSNLIDLNVLK